MDNKFLVFDSMDLIKEHYIDFIEIFNEYSKFRLITNYNFRPEHTLNQLHNAGTNYDQEIKKFDYFSTSKLVDHGLLDYFAKKMEDYFVYIVVMDEGKAAGQASIEKYTDDIVILHRVFVRPEFRGKGFGMSLLSKIASTAKLDGFSKIYLDTIPPLQDAIRMYKKFGFKIRDYYPTSLLPVKDAEILQSIFMEYNIN